MDIQLKRGLLDVCVLSTLTDGDSYGYKMIRDLAGHVEISESTLYPILKRLEAGDCVTSYTAEHNSRLRKYYKITPAGREKIAEFLVEWGEVNRICEFIKGAVNDEQE